jgi:hypothetical protein
VYKLADHLTYAKANPEYQSECPEILMRVIAMFALPVQDFPREATW